MSIHRRQLLARSALVAATAPLALHARAFAGLLTAGAPRATLTAYTSEDELRQALTRWRERSAPRRTDARVAELSKNVESLAAAAPQLAAKSEAAGAVADKRALLLQ